MKKIVKNLYKEAIANKEFDVAMYKQDPNGYVKPNIFSKELTKIAYTAAYYGYLLGKGTYNRDNYI